MARSNYIALLLCIALTCVVTAQATTVTFKIDYLLEYKQGFVIAGNVSALGSWVPTNAPQMTVTNDKYWSVNVTLTNGAAIAYKPVKVFYDTKEAITWYPGNNLEFTVSGDVMVVVINWYETYSIKAHHVNAKHGHNVGYIKQSVN